MNKQQTIEDDWIDMLRQSHAVKWVIATLFYGDSLDDKFISRSLDKLSGTGNDDDDIRFFVEGEPMIIEQRKKFMALIRGIDDSLLAQMETFYETEDTNDYAIDTVDNLCEYNHLPASLISRLRKTFSTWFNKHLKGFQIVQVKEGNEMCIVVLVKYPKLPKEQKGTGSRLIVRLKKTLPQDGYICALASTCVSRVQFSFYAKHGFKFIKFKTAVQHGRYSEDNLSYFIVFKPSFAAAPLFKARDYYRAMYQTMCVKNSDLYAYLLKNKNDSSVNKLFADLHCLKQAREGAIKRFNVKKEHVKNLAFFEKHLCVSFDTLSLDMGLLSKTVFHVANTANTNSDDSENDEEEEQEKEQVVVEKKVRHVKKGRQRRRKEVIVVDDDKMDIDDIDDISSSMKVKKRIDKRHVHEEAEEEDEDEEEEDAFLLMCNEMIQSRTKEIADLRALIREHKKKKVRVEARVEDEVKEQVEEEKEEDQQSSAVDDDAMQPMQITLACV